MGWKPADKIAVTLHNFKALRAQHLSVSVGDLLYILEELESGEWYRGYMFYEPSRRGIFPASYVKIKDSTSRKVGSRVFVVPAEDELAIEATEGLRAWRWKLRELYVCGSRDRWRPLLHAMEEVVNWRRAILHSNATIEALQDTKTKLSATIDEINRQLRCPLTPRDPDTGRAVDYQGISILNLWKLHRDRRADSTSDHAQHGTLHRRRQEAPHSHLHHLYMRVDAIDHTFPEDCEIFFFLSSDGKGQLSERYLVAMTKGGEKKLQASSDKKSCVFTDLGTRDMESSLYLVCQIIRRGKMLLDKKYHSSHTFRRPYACGVLDMRAVLLSKEAGDKLSDHHQKMTMPLYLCATNHESNFATFHTTVIQKTGAKGGQKPGCAFTLFLRAFHRKELSAVRREVPILFSKTTETVHKLGFPDVILPGDARNDIYVTLESGSFSKGSKTAERNVEVAINVVDRAGTVIPRAIVVGAGAQPIHEYESFIYYHNNNPKWNETFKLVIPFEKVPDAHLRIVFRHLAKDESAREKAEKSFSFAYMKVMKDDGSIIQDGCHDLYVYETGSRKWSDPSVYLNQASGREDLAQSTLSSSPQTLKSRTVKTLRGSTMTSSQASRSFREVVTLSTLTCSTKLTQRIELLLLLKWRQKSRDLSVVLKNVVHVGGEEVVKFLQDTLDCLFDILSDNNEKYGELVFEALVAIFGLMSDDRYHHFTTVLDIYIEKHFSALLAHKFLLASFKRNLQDLMLADLQHPKLIKIIQSMPYLFKFIVQSSHLHQKHMQREDPSFKKELAEVFASFNRLLCLPETQLSGIHRIQRVVLEYFPVVLPELVRIFSPGEIAVFTSGLLDSVRNMDIAAIPLQKLTFITSVLQSPIRLLDNEGTRRKLVPTLVSHLISHMDHRMLRTQYSPDDRGNQEVVNCVGQLLSCLSNHQLKCSPDDVQNVVPLMYPLLRLCKELPRQNKLSFPNMVNFLMLLGMMSDDHFSMFFKSLEYSIENTFGRLIQDLMEVLRSYICNPPYPEDWCTLYLLQNRVIARTLQNCSNALVEYALNDASFSPMVWDNFFGLCAQFLVQPCLQLEKLSDYKRHHFQQQFGDVRVSIGRHVASLWHKLGDKKGSFIPNLVKPFLDISLIKHKELRKVALPLIMDIMVCEQWASSNFKRVETEVFDKMDDLIAGGRGDEEYRDLFQDILQPLCMANNLGSTGEIFINSVSRLIGLLLDYRNVSNDGGHQDRRMGCMLNLLNFYREIEKEELYIRYIYKLAELHKKAQSYTEAGFTLLLRAKGLEWSTEPLPPEGRFGGEVEQMKVKEVLYKEVIELFDKGQAWEHGIPLCKELCSVYEAEIQYTELAAILQREAEFFKKIICELRVEPEYFMVASYGKGFPLFLRNKIFIHRGLPYERLTSFIKRLTDEYSTAELLKSTKPPGDEIKNSSGMYLQVRSVQTIPEEQKRFEGKTVPDSVSRYYKANDVCKFRYDRPFHRGEKRKDCEIATLWLDRTNFITTNSFPGEMAWFEVASMEEVELDPLAIAIETVSSKISEVRTLTTLHKENASLNINPLSMLLSGLIDAAVGGGIKNYRMVFFNTDYISSNRQDGERVQYLKKLIEEQVIVLKKGLELHGKRIAPALNGMQMNLEEKLELMELEAFPERRKKPIRSQTVKKSPLPPTPLEESTNKNSQTMSVRGRRPTGKAKNRISQVGEGSPPSLLRRSATTKPMTSKDSLVQPLPYQPVRKTESQIPETSAPGLNDGTVDVLPEEEDDQDTYESVDEYLATRAATANVTPSAAPNYAAPPPPGVKPGEHDDHEYTPVKVTDGDVQVEPQEDVWAPLPLKKRISVPHVGLHSSPNQLRSPSVPHIGMNPAERGLVPSEPSPPPSSPSTRPPPSRGHDASDNSPEQPKLPPKKRREMSKLYSESDASKWRGSPPQVPTPQDDIHFSRLSPSGLNKPQTEPEDDTCNHLGITPGKGNSPRTSTSPLSSSPTAPPTAPPTDDQVYFDHLAQPVKGNKPRPPPPPTTDGDNVYFDHLAQPVKGNKPHPPPPPTTDGDNVYFDHLAQPVKGNKPRPPPPPTTDGDNVYFDHLAEPVKGNKPRPPPPPTTDGDNVYFDNLAQPVKGNKPHPPPPPTTDGDNVYWDHLASPLPSKQPLPVGQDGEDDADFSEHSASTPTKPATTPANPTSGPEVLPPPLPTKKKGKMPQRQLSTPEESPRETLRPIPRPRTDTHHPVPTPRTTAPDIPSRPPKSGAPVLPPKPVPPMGITKPALPPKETELQRPPRPAKSKPFT